MGALRRLHGTRQLPDLSSWQHEQVLCGGQGGHSGGLLHIQVGPAVSTAACTPSSVNARLDVGCCPAAGWRWSLLLGRAAGSCVSATASCSGCGATNCMTCTRPTATCIWCSCHWMQLSQGSGCVRCRQRRKACHRGGVGRAAAAQWLAKQAATSFPAALLSDCCRRRHHTSPTSHSPCGMQVSYMLSCVVSQGLIRLPQLTPALCAAISSSESFLAEEASGHAPGRGVSSKAWGTSIVSADPLGLMPPCLCLSPSTQALRRLLEAAQQLHSPLDAVSTSI